MNTEFYWVAVALTIVMSASRITRVLTFDKFPPTLWIREKWVMFVAKTKINPEYVRLWFCGYCMSFWVTLIVIATADLSGIFDGDPLAPWMTPAWWFINGTFGASYLAAIVMANDADNEDDD